MREHGDPTEPPAGSAEAARLYADPNPWIAEIDGRRAAYVATLPPEQRHLVASLNFGGKPEVRADARRTLIAALVAHGFEGVVAVLEHAWARAARGQLEPAFLATSMRGGAWAMRVRQHGEAQARAKPRPQLKALTWEEPEFNGVPVTNEEMTAGAEALLARLENRTPRG